MRRGGAEGNDERATLTFLPLSAEDDYAPEDFDFFDEDDYYYYYYYYSEFVLSPPEPPADDSDTDRIATPIDPARGERVHLSAKHSFEPLYHQPPERWLRMSAEQIGFAHNGFHVDHEQRFRDVSEISAQPRHSRHAADARGFDPDADTYGRHAMPASD